MDLWNLLDDYKFKFSLIFRLNAALVADLYNHVTTGFSPFGSQESAESLKKESK